MKDSPIYPNYETTHDFRFDPQMGFSQFLEEARQHASDQVNDQTSLKHQEEEKNGKMSQQEKKKAKKSWKNKVISWLKHEKKSKTNPSKEAITSAHITNPRRVHVSGPIYGSCRKVVVETKHKSSTSGPISLANLFIPTKRVESEVPYMCLGSPKSLKSQSHQGVKTYGPVYLVT